MIVSFVQRPAVAFRKTVTIAQKEGVSGLAARLKGRTYGRFRSFLQREWPHWQGLLIELLGNRWRIEGVTIRVDNPYILRRDKWQVLGAFERAERALLRKHFPRDRAVIELGGCVGALACIMNRRMAQPEKHVVVEAHPGLIPTLEANRDLNRCRFRIVAAAIAYGSDEVAFHLNPGFASGSVTSAGAAEARPISVPARMLESIASEAGFERFDLICDIEGAEAELIAREGDLLRQRVGCFMLEMHQTLLGGDAIRQMHERLKALGFTPVESAESVYFYRNDSLS